MRDFLARRFKFEALGTDLRTEVTGGLTTFVTMAYIVAVNPGILSEALGADLFPELLFATCVSAAVATYIESAAGISEGARSGFASVVTGLLFLGTLFLTPLVQAIPPFATAPALVVVGVMPSAAQVAWDDFSDALPAFLTLIAIPLTFSIADGLALGFVAFPIVKRLGGRGDEVPPLVDLLAVIFIAKYLFQ